MTPITINLEPEDRSWLEQKAKQNQTTISALISQAVKRLRAEETNSASFDLLLEQTRGIWKGGDALVYNNKLPWDLKGMGTMTLKTIIKITADGNLELPPEIRSRLQSGDKFFLWEENDTIILKKVNASQVDSIKQQEKIKGDDRFFEIADRLAELNEVDPITEEEIQEEIRAYRTV